MLAAGIYGIDPVEALNQNIPKPGPQATANASDALGNVNSLNSSAANLNSNVYTLSNGAYHPNGVADVTTKVGSSYQTLGAGEQFTGQVGKSLKSLGLHKDKPCSSVPRKDVVIGRHSLEGAAGSGTKIVIKNITYSQITALTAVIQKINGVSSVSNDDFSNRAATMSVVNNMKVKELVDKILQSNTGFNFDVESVSATSATLTIK